MGQKIIHTIIRAMSGMLMASQSHLRPLRKSLAKLATMKTVSRVGTMPKRRVIMKRVMMLPSRASHQPDMPSR